MWCQDTGPRWMWACLNCGNRLDARILRNRVIQSAEQILRDASRACEGDPIHGVNTYPSRA